MLGGELPFEDAGSLRRKSLVLGQVVENLVPRRLRLNVDVHHGTALRLVVQARDDEHRDLWIGRGPIEEPSPALLAEESGTFPGGVLADVLLARRDAQLCAANEGRSGERSAVGAPAIPTVTVHKRSERTIELVLDCSAVALTGFHGPTVRAAQRINAQRRIRAKGVAARVQRPAPGGTSRPFSAARRAEALDGRRRSRRARRRIRPSAASGWAARDSMTRRHAYLESIR